MSANQFIGSEYVTRIEQIHPPQPVESPDDWIDITDPDHVLRERIDHVKHQYRGWETVQGLARYKWSGVDKVDFIALRCRRRDYPQKPVEVHSGGPYVARSEYERACGERDELRPTITDLQSMIIRRSRTVDELRKQVESLQAEVVDYDRELANERASGGQVIAGLRVNIDSLNELLRTREKAAEVTQAETIRYAERCDKLERQLADKICGYRCDASNSNGWPLVPVDPSCIPQGHRAVEVTDKVNGKTTVNDFGRVHTWNSGSMYVRLVVEPIPTPTPDAPLPRPEFPAWIRAGWWVSMDAGGFWYMSKDEPVASDLNPESQSYEGTWDTPHDDDVPISQHISLSMRAIPTNRWREAKWKVE